mmetsp:Transcript_7569/g.24662  ORF Transcript_7569/g.24662 Transcript_7569/m.24662 type:complete len:288 (+) Transcript_7569:766-1629(+)
MPCLCAAVSATSKSGSGTTASMPRLLSDSRACFKARASASKSSSRIWSSVASSINFVKSGAPGSHHAASDAIWRADLKAAANLRRKPGFCSFKATAPMWCTSAMDAEAMGRAVSLKTSGSRSLLSRLARARRLLRARGAMGGMESTREVSGSTISAAKTPDMDAKTWPNFTSRPASASASDASTSPTKRSASRSAKGRAEPPRLRNENSAWSSASLASSAFLADALRLALQATMQQNAQARFLTCAWHMKCREIARTAPEATAATAASTYGAMAASAENARPAARTP